MILAIDPGNKESAYALLDDDLKPMHFEKIENTRLRLMIYRTDFIATKINYAAVEMVASYGMAVGAEVFETCVWAGRFIEAIKNQSGIEAQHIFRKDEKINLCGSMKANDSNIRQALIDRFGPVGTKKNKGWFYGVSKDVWSAIAVGVTYHDMHLKGEENAAQS